MIRPTSAVLVLLSLAACKEDDARLANAAAAPEAMVSATVIASGRTAGGEAPRIVLIADGKEVGQTLVTASREGGEWGSYAFGWRGSRPNVLVVRYVNDSGDRDL